MLYSLPFTLNHARLDTPAATTARSVISEREQALRRRLHNEDGRYCFGNSSPSPSLTVILLNFGATVW